MDTLLIDRIKKITSADDQAINDFLENQSLDQMYQLIDANRKSNDAAIGELVKSLMDPTPQQPAVEPVKESKKISTEKIKVPMMTPRNVVAVELQKGQYQPKTTPNKTVQLDKMDKKYQTRMDDSHVNVGEPVVEGVLGMSSMPYIKKMLTLAGRPAEDHDIQKAMEDFMGNFQSYRGLEKPESSKSHDFQLTISPEIMKSVGLPEQIPQDDFDNELDSMADAELMQAAPPPSDVPARVGDENTSIHTIRCAFDEISRNIHNIKVSQFTEVHQMFSNLFLTLDKIGNNANHK